MSPGWRANMTVERHRVRMLGPAARQALFERLRAAMPEPATELTYGSTYQLLVSVILSAQATDKSVNLATGPLFRVAGTPRRWSRSARQASRLHPHDRVVAHEGEAHPGSIAHDTCAAWR
jgi:hypothetical protein